MTVLVGALLTRNINRTTQLASKALCVGRLSDARTRGVGMNTLLRRCDSAMNSVVEVQSNLWKDEHGRESSTASSGSACFSLLFRTLVPEFELSWLLSKKLDIEQRTPHFFGNWPAARADWRREVSRCQIRST
jgi:hypothetical protein